MVFLAQAGELVTVVRCGRAWELRAVALPERPAAREGIFFQEKQVVLSAHFKVPCAEHKRAEGMVQAGCVWHTTQARQFFSLCATESA